MNMQAMMQQAQKIQKEIAKAKNEINDKEFEITKSFITVKANGKKEIIKLLLNQELDQDDEEMLVDMLADKTIVVDVDKQADMAETFGDRVADKITAIAGSWTFIIVFLIVILIWMGVNVYFLRKDSFDPYPFILLNLILL